MSALPEGWTEARLPEMITSSGVFNDGDWVESKDQDPNGNVRLIQLADVGDGRYRDRSARFLTHQKAQELGCTYLMPGDVLIARMPDPLGRACLFPGDTRACVTVVDVCVVRPGEGSVNPRWLVHTLNAPQTRSAIAAYQKGTTRKRISRGNLALVPFPVPPLAEQDRIVAAIEEVLSRLDAGVAVLERVRQSLTRMRASAYLRLDIAASEEASPSCMADAAAFIVDGDHNPPKRTLSGIPYLTAKHVKRGVISVEGATYVSPDDFEVLRRRYDPRPGDVLITCVGTLGEVAIVPPGLSFAADRNLAAVRPTEALLPRYLEAILRSPRQQRIMISGSGSTAQPHIYLKDLRALHIPVPPPPHQQELVRRLDETLSVIDRLDSEVTLSESRSVALRSSLLTAAFAGALVPHDPSDEPASALLQRMAIEQTSSDSARSTSARQRHRKATA